MLDKIKSKYKNASVGGVHVGVELSIKEYNTKKTLKSQIINNLDIADCLSEKSNSEDSRLFSKIIDDNFIYNEYPINKPLIDYNYENIWKEMKKHPSIFKHFKLHLKQAIEDIESLDLKDNRVEFEEIKNDISLYI